MESPANQKSISGKSMTKLWFVLVVFNVFINVGASQGWFENNDETQVTQEVCGQFEIHAPKNNPENNDITVFTLALGVSTHSQKTPLASFNSLQNNKNDLLQKCLAPHWSTPTSIKSISVSLMRRGPPAQS